MKLNSKKKYFQIEESIFHRKVHVFLNYSSDDVNKWCGGGKDDSKNDADFGAFSFSLTDAKTGVTEWGIQVKQFDWTISNQGSLIHEIVHTVIKIWRQNNIPYTYDNQEFLAHSISNLYEDIAAKILNIKKIKRK